MDLALKGKVAFVTGGSEGIGEGICLELAREGASVAVCARRAEPLQRLTRKLAAFGVPSLTVQADVTHKDDIERAVDTITAELGPIDILVNNAGGGASSSHWVEDPDEVWEACYALNLWPCIRVTRRVFTQMKARGRGSIVIVASIGGHTASWPGVSDYSSAKGAQLLLTKNWAVDFAPHGVRVNAVNPGFVRTPLWETLAAEFIPARGPDIEAVFAAISADLPARRMGKPEDVGKVVAFLASDAAASFITGACWDVDGGATHKI